MVCVYQFRSSNNNIPKKGKKKAQATGNDLDVEILSKMEIIYKDMKVIMGIDPKFRWGQIYQMIKD